MTKLNQASNVLFWGVVITLAAWVAVVDVGRPSFAGRAFVPPASRPQVVAPVPASIPVAVRVR